MNFTRPPITHDLTHPPARGPVLLLTCMDLRLIDEVLEFMHADGLTNRYDHVILAGAALGAVGANAQEYEHWKKTFFDHLKIAHQLHHIKDVYIIEHRDCGAYREFLGADGDFDDDDAAAEAACHREYADQLRGLIESWAAENDATIRVKAFLMDLRGNVTLLDPPPKPAGGRRKK